MQMLKLLKSSKDCRCRILNAPWSTDTTKQHLPNLKATHTKLKTPAIWTCQTILRIRVDLRTHFTDAPRTARRVWVSTPQELLRECVDTMKSKRLRSLTRLLDPDSTWTNTQLQQAFSWETTMRLRKSTTLTRHKWSEDPTTTMLREPRDKLNLIFERFDQWNVN